MVVKASQPVAQELEVKNWAVTAVVVMGLAGLIQNADKVALGVLPVPETVACTESAPRTVPM